MLWQQWKRDYMRKVALDALAIVCDDAQESELAHTALVQIRCNDALQEWHSVAQNGTVIFTSIQPGSLARLVIAGDWAFGQSAVWCHGKGTRTALQMLEKLAAWCNFGAARSAEVKSLESNCSQPSAFSSYFPPVSAALRQ